MELEKILSRVVLIAPFAHLAVCSLYIYGFSMGFGLSISGLFTATDFFIVTLQNLIVIYPVALMLPAIIWYFQHQSTSDDDGGMASVSEFSVRRKIFVGVIVSISVFVFFWFAISRIQGFYFSWYLLLQAILICMLPFAIQLASRAQLNRAKVSFSLNCAMFVLAVVALGIEKGDLYRRGSFVQLTNNDMKCGNQTVLLPIGDRFLAVGTDATRNIINDDCKVVFKFERTKLYRNVGIWEGPIKALTSLFRKS